MRHENGGLNRGEFFRYETGNNSFWYFFVSNGVISTGSAGASLQLPTGPSRQKSHDAARDHGRYENADGKEANLIPSRMKR